MDPDVMVKDSEKIVYSVHIEAGALVQVRVVHPRSEIILKDPDVPDCQLSHAIKTPRHQWGL